MVATGGASQGLKSRRFLRSGWCRVMDI